jgi:hypothetical protein
MICAITTYDHNQPSPTKEYRGNLDSFLDFGSAFQQAGFSIEWFDTNGFMAHSDDVDLTVVATLSEE